MARYRTKDEIDLRWNRIRRRITRELDIQIADWREDKLNKLLGEAFTLYAKSLETGDKLELEEKYSAFVRGALDEALDVTVDAPA